MNIEQLYLQFQQSTGITTDSRNIQKGNIFFALKGEKFNGNIFAEEALAKGAMLAIADEKHFAENARIVLVENALATLQELALFHRKKFTGKLIALTGSNGKTTTKELIAAVLATTFKTQATKGNLNNHIGIPLTILSMPTTLDFAVIEMGANHQKEIDGYCHYVQPDFGLITNVGLAHIEGFGGFEGVIKGKTELYRFMAKNGGKLFLNSDNEILCNKANEAGFTNERIITYGTGKNAFCSGEMVEGEFLSLKTLGETIHTNLVGNYNFENVLAACCIAKYFGVSANNVKLAIENYVPANNRSQQITLNGNSIVLDCYNANPTSMKAAIKSFAAAKGEPKIAILGGMKEMGEESTQLHSEIALLAKQLNFAKVIFIGNEFQHVDFGVKFSNTAEAQNWLLANPIKSAHILVKGSRAYKLETLFIEQ